ncbi:hypothetical protein, partial [Plasmodium yoelii yoelii]
LNNNKALIIQVTLRNKEAIIVYLIS